jgi:hypothetical protein
VTVEGVEEGGAGSGDVVGMRKVRLRGGVAALWMGGRRGAPSFGQSKAVKAAKPTMRLGT